MDIREIIYVNKVAELKNLTKAAEALHMTQPSLSQSIKKIEDKLNVQLFIRSKRGVRLTETGEKFIADAKPLLSYYDEFMAKTRHYASTRETFTLGLYKLVHTTPIHDAIMGFIASNAKENYVIKVDNIPELEKMLANGQIDLAVIKYPPVYQPDSSLTRECLYKDRLQVLLSKNNPLTKMDQLTIKDIAHLKLITSAKHEYPYAMTEAIQSDANVKMDTLISTNYSNMNMIMDLVENDLGITFATLDVCRKYATDKIHYVPLAPEYYYDVSLVYKKINENVLRLVDCIKSNIGI